MQENVETIVLKDDVHKEENTTIKPVNELDDFEDELKEENKTNTEYVSQPHLKRHLFKHLHNLKLILDCTNATMILKHGDKGYLCCYCSEAFQEPLNLKAHTLTEHPNSERFYGNTRADETSRLLVKLDITKLRCTICNSSIDSLEDVFTHLTNKHKKKFYTDIKNQIFPFKFETNELTCCLCASDAAFATFSALHEHMHKHFRHFICTECDAGFVNHMSLVFHNMAHKRGTYTCRHCPVVFDNVIKRKHHEIRYHKSSDKLNKCHLCNEGFKEHPDKEMHLFEVHGITPTIYKCGACEKTFSSNSFLKTHVRRFHLLEKDHKCPECDKTFFRENCLKRHMAMHKGSNDYKCQVCSNYFANKSSLNRHMRIHNNDKRFQCTKCDLRFVQKPSLTWHMKAKHSEPSPA